MNTQRFIRLLRPIPSAAHLLKPLSEVFARISSYFFDLCWLGHVTLDLARLGRMSVAGMAVLLGSRSYGFNIGEPPLKGGYLSQDA